MHKRMKVLWILICAAVCISFLAARYPSAEESWTGMRVLWDRAQGYPLHGAGDDYSGLGDTITSRGATLNDLRTNAAYTPALLANYDVVIICLRSMILTKDEQEALVNFVRGGGGLLFISDRYTVNTATNAVLNNFRMQFTASGFGYSNILSFAFPATLPHRPITQGEAGDACRLEVSAPAVRIAGSSSGGGGVAIDSCIIGLGAFSGKGRVIAVGCTALWRTYG